MELRLRMEHRTAKQSFMLMFNYIPVNISCESDFKNKGDYTDAQK